MKERDVTFDIMKGIGILLVVAGHVLGYWYPTVNHFFKSFRMPMFFLVAGYFSKPYVDASTTKKEVKRFFSRLYPPFVITQFMIILWAVLMAFIKHEGWDPTIRESLSLLWADVDGPMTPWGKLSLGVIWFLLALFVSKVLLLFFSRWKGWAIPISFSLAIGAILLHHVFPYSLWCVSLGLTALPFVTIGWWFRSHPIPLWLKITAIVCWVLAVAFSEIDMYSFTWRIYPLDVVGACGGTYCLYFLCRIIKNHLKITSKVFAALGVWSLAIMCVHCFEIYSHIGNRLKAMAGVELSALGLGLWRMLLAIGLAIVLVHIPKVKKLFV